MNAAVMARRDHPTLNPRHVICNDCFLISYGNTIRGGALRHAYAILVS